MTTAVAYPVAGCVVEGRRVEARHVAWLMTPLGPVEIEDSDELGDMLPTWHYGDEAEREGAAIGAT